jgi:hypothetical protein
LDEGDQPALGFGEQEDIFLQGLAEAALREIALEMGGQIGGAEAMAEGLGIGPARQGRQSGDVVHPGSADDHRPLRKPVTASK